MYHEEVRPWEEATTSQRNELPQVCPTKEYDEYGGGGIIGG
jgi:hypothetical protein